MVSKVITGKLLFFRVLTLTTMSSRWVEVGCRGDCSDQVVPFYPILGEGSFTKMDYRKEGTLILTSLLENLGFPSLGNLSSPQKVLLGTRPPSDFLVTRLASRLTPRSGPKTQPRSPRYFCHSRAASAGREVPRTKTSALAGTRGHSHTWNLTGLGSSETVMFNFYPFS